MGRGSSTIALRTNGMELGCCCAKVLWWCHWNVSGLPGYDNTAPLPLSSLGIATYMRPRAASRCFGGRRLSPSRTRALECPGQASLCAGAARRHLMGSLMRTRVLGMQAHPSYEGLLRTSAGDTLETLRPFCKMTACSRNFATFFFVCFLLVGARRRAQGTAWS